MTAKPIASDGLTMHLAERDLETLAEATGLAYLNRTLDRASVARAIQRKQSKQTRVDDARRKKKLQDLLLSMLRP